MKPYTVTLIRPAYMCTDTPFGLDVYVATVTASSEYAAIPIAQAEVFKADKRDKLKPRLPSDYLMANVFEGHPKVLLWSWTL